MINDYYVIICFAVKLNALYSVNNNIYAFFNKYIFVIYKRCNLFQF